VRKGIAVDLKIQEEVQIIFAWAKETFAKAATAQEQLRRETTNPFRHLRASRDCPEKNLSFITQDFYVISL
jgi:hypothetical protein